MGLDNGIIVKNVDIKKVPNFITRTWYSGAEWQEGEIEVCYWRRMWVYRDYVIKIIGLPIDDNTSKVILTDDNLAKFQKMLWNYCRPRYKFLHSQNWGYWDTVKKNLRDICAIRWLRAYLKKHSSSESYFYDSY